MKNKNQNACFTLFAIILSMVIVGLVYYGNSGKDKRQEYMTIIDTGNLFMYEYKNEDISEKQGEDKLLDFLDKMKVFYSSLERINYFDGDKKIEEDDYKKFSKLIIKNNALDPSLENIKVNYNEYVIYSVLNKESDFKESDIKYLIGEFPVVREKLRYLNINEVKDLYTSMVDTNIENQQAKKMYMEKISSIFEKFTEK